MKNRKAQESKPLKVDIEGKAKEEKPENARFGKRRGNKPSFSQRRDKFNDLSWYTKYPGLFENSSRLGFNHIGGTGWLKSIAGLNYNANSDGVSETNVLGVRYITSPGFCKNETSGFALQIRQLYLAMKRKYRGLNTYQPGDLAVTLFCIMEFYRYIAKLERIYGVCKFYSARNRIMPNTLPSALHFNYSDVASHLADFRLGINTLIIKAASLCLPSGIDLINRWFLLESNVFKDSEGARSTYIIFDDYDMFYTYQATAFASGGSAILSFVDNHFASQHVGKWDELIKGGEDMLDLLLTDDDVTLQVGDIVSYFTKPDGSTELLKLQEIPEDYIVVPVYNEDIVLQVHNSTSIGNKGATLVSGTNPFIPANYQAGNNGALGIAMNIDANHVIGIVQNVVGAPTFELCMGQRFVTRTADNVDVPVFDFGVAADRAFHKLKHGNVIIDTWKDVPSEADVMEMTRLTTAIEAVCDTFQQGVTTYSYQFIVHGGTELVMDYVYHYIMGSTGQPALRTLESAARQTFGADEYEAMSRVDWCPLLYLTSVPVSNTSPGGFQCLYTVGDLDNARGVDIDTLSKIHDAAIMSLFKIESVSAFDQKAVVLD